MKKSLFTLVILIFMINTGFAQQRTVERSFKVDSDQNVVLDLKFGETISIKAWDKNEVSFKSDISINNNKLNDALVFDIEEQNGQLKIAADYDQEMLKSGSSQDCPDHYSSYYRNNDDKDSYVICSEISYTLFVPANVNLDIDTISGDIELVGLAGPIRAKSISGFVDLSWPSGKPADIDLKTISGEAFTDIDNLEMSNKKDHIPLVGYKIKGTLAGGGPIVSLESISGNIYLRKGS